MTVKVIITLESLIADALDSFKKFDSIKWGSDQIPGLSEAEQIVWAVAEKLSERELTRLELYIQKPQNAWRALVLDWSERVAQGEPLAFIVRFRFFNGRRYFVNAEVLTPRPETEGLVELATLKLGRSKKGLEIGIGSGVISCELLLFSKGLKMVATEVSPEAIEVAKKNLFSFGVDSRIEILSAGVSQNIFDSIEPQEFDFIVSNPPYLESDQEISRLVWNTEPQIALSALANPYLKTNDSLYFYRALAEKGRNYLVPGGWIALELSDVRAQQVRDIFDAAGWAEIEVAKDLTGRPRYLCARI